MYKLRMLLLRTFKPETYRRLKSFHEWMLHDIITKHLLTFKLKKYPLDTLMRQNHEGKSAAELGRLFEQAYRESEEEANG